MDRKMSEQKLNIEFVKEVENYPCIYDYRRTDYARKEIIDKAWVKIGTKFNLSGPQCRERWKNLRTVLSRNLRPNEGNGKSRASKQQRKPYYLFEAMKFAVPFIKSHNSVPTYFKPRESSNSPSDKEEKSEDQGDNDEEMKEPICHIKVENIDYEPSRSPSPEYMTSPPPSPQVNIVEAPSPPTPTPPPLTAPKRTRRNRTQSHDSAEVDVDEKVPKNFKSKKAKNKKNTKVDLTKISKKRFLLSLLSDVYSMDNIQMRSFRIKVLNLINDITQTPSTGLVCQCRAARPEPPTTPICEPGPSQASHSQTPSRAPEPTYQNNVEMKAPPLTTVQIKIEKHDE